MSRVNEFKAGDRLNEARLKSWADAINRVHNFGPGKWEELSSELALFEVGDAWVAGSGPSATPPEPNGYYKSTDCHLVYYFPGTGEYHIKTGTDRGHTIWSINAGKTAPSLSPGDFAWCVYNIQASRWEVLTSTGGSSGHEEISFRVLSVGYFVDPGTADHFCRVAQVEVLAVSCGASSVKPGDEVTVWDPSACYFDIPIELLYNMRGTALRMAWDAGETTGTGTGTVWDREPTGIPPCFSEATPEEIAASPYANACYWIVQSMCCVEDWFNN
jgi:hypothetical protein